MKKIKIKFSCSELKGLHYLLTSVPDGDDIENMVIQSTLLNLYLKLTKLIIFPRKEYSISLSIVECWVVRKCFLFFLDTYGIYEKTLALKIIGIIDQQITSNKINSNESIYLR